ncbi:hypothetical protein J5N97_015209 [Dioscorea zingiberensis]|uniref:GDSL esterase/lipase n=1 Tax=Dioscorea zingiberensis TaxID=325984 RepID=A0A9D5CWR1_9LILI|nr:hypothetical protein J5N97_015209 [Dioscorea zingiberensis]
MAVIMRVLLQLLFSFMFVSGKISSSVSKEEGLKGHFIFGDSHVDSGNNNYLPSTSRADLPPNGIDFKASGGWPTGRFTNGRTITDIIGEELGQPNYAPPYLAPSTKGAALLNGVNYASGAGGILNHTGSLFVNRLGMDIQIDYFNKTRKQLDEVVEGLTAKEFLMKKSIFSIVIGSNDILNNYLLPGISIAQMLLEPPEQFVQHLISHFRGQLMRLYSLDARKFVVTNIGPLGCIPYQKTVNRVSSDSECVSLPNDLAMNYNARLKELLEELNHNLPEAKFLYANLYDILMEVITNHQQYGFETAGVACCGIGGKYAGFIPCGPTSPMCWDRSKYVFWDPYHPTEATNLIIAKNFLDGQQNQISPNNIRQLKYL